MSNGTSCPPSVTCVVLSKDELNQISNILLGYEGIMGVIGGYVTGAAFVTTIAGGVVAGAAFAWDIGDVQGIRDMIGDNLQAANENGSVTVEIDNGLLSDTYNVQGDATGNMQLITTNLLPGRKVLNIVFGFYTVKHALFGNP